MRVILATMAFVTLAGCASGTITALNDEHYGCSATGNFFDFSGETAIAECRKKTPTSSASSMVLRQS